MFCSTSITVHLLRGALALMAIAAAFAMMPRVWPSLLLVPIAFVLMRGCPMCWTMGLFETLRGRGR